MLESIKPNVWRLREDGRDVVIKAYEELALYLKVRQLHKQLMQLDFTDSLDAEFDDENQLIIQPYYARLQETNYANPQVRKQVIRVLTALHDTEEQESWWNQTTLPASSLYMKWQMRLSRILAVQDKLEEFLDAKSVRYSIEQAQLALDEFIHYDAHHTLIHGDIAHHNFLMGARGIRIIDFDLASYADPDEEWILLLQRFLPFADYDLQLLIDEHPDFLRVLEEQPVGLRYPNELFREWLAFLQKPHPKKQERLLAFSAKAIENHRKLWYDG